MLPVMENREVIGYAKTAKQAEKMIRKTVTVHKAGKLHVHLRDAFMAELLELPVAFTWSISYGVQ
jgi:hypothetical protein